jgi:hypothetical protein
MKYAIIGMKYSKIGMKYSDRYETKRAVYEKNLSGTTRVNFIPLDVFHTYFVY